MVFSIKNIDSLYLRKRYLSVLCLHPPRLRRAEAFFLTRRARAPPLAPDFLALPATVAARPYAAIRPWHVTFLLRLHIGYLRPFGSRKQRLGKFER